jgi:hypothetical protein
MRWDERVAVLREIAVLRTPNVPAVARCIEPPLRRPCRSYGDRRRALLVISATTATTPATSVTTPPPAVLMLRIWTAVDAIPVRHPSVMLAGRHWWATRRGRAARRRSGDVRWHATTGRAGAVHCSVTVARRWGRRRCARRRRCGLWRRSAWRAAHAALSRFGGRRRCAGGIPIADGCHRRVGTAARRACTSSFVVRRGLAVRRWLVEDFRARPAERARSATAP